MNPDDMYPNDSSYFLPQEPPEQVSERRKEKAKTLQNQTILRELIIRLEERIAFYGSVDAMPNEAKTDPVKFMYIHNANQLTRDNLRAEKEYIESLLDTHVR